MGRAKVCDVRGEKDVRGTINAPQEEAEQQAASKKPNSVV
jgi:hypothetical protein